MPWLTFFATSTDLLTLVDRLVFTEGGRVYEAYSRFDHEARELANIQALTALAGREGLGGLHLGLSLSDVGAPPRTRRIELRPGAVPGHTFRHTVEGCSLLTLQCGRLQDGVLDASHLVWWTEASARAKAAPEMRADAVDWKRLAAVGRRAQRLVRRDLACAEAGGRAVLAGALERVRGGVTLHDSHAPREQLIVAEG
jgi:hypothetical protein